MSHGELVQRDGCDVFGVSVDAQHGSESVRCPHCGRAVQAARFAPHLEKCMGMGRSSARVAKQRVLQPVPSETQSQQSYGVHLLSPAAVHAAAVAAAAPNSANAATTAAAAAAAAAAATVIDIDGGDDDDSFDGKRRKVTKPAARRENSIASLRALPAAELAAQLRNICGVISSTTGKMCTRSLRCAYHTDQQRESIRQLLFPRSMGSGAP
jgi:SAGA-associated factor 11